MKRNRPTFKECGTCKKPGKSVSGYCKKCMSLSTLADRLWSRVTKDGAEILKGSPCWEWTGHRRKYGYGYIWFERTYIGCNRAAMIVTGQPLPTGQYVRHKCDNPPCCRPDHLELGTPLDNSNDKSRRGRAQTKLSAENVLDIKRRSASGEPTSNLSKEYGVAWTTVRAIILGRTWRYVTPNATTVSEGKVKE